jgi:hypothetical protein
MSTISDNEKMFEYSHTSTIFNSLVAIAGDLVHNPTLELMTNPGMTRKSPPSFKLKIATPMNNKEIFAILKTKFNESSKANKSSGRKL